MADGDRTAFADIAAQFVRARRAALSLDAFPGVLPVDLHDAYACQSAALALWPDSDAVAGWKVARIAPSWQARYAQERLVGPILQRNVHRPASGVVTDCPIFDGGFAAVEAEIGIVVAHDAPPGRTPWTIESATDLIGEMCIGVEIASSPLATLNDLGPGAVISDFGNNWGVIRGARIESWRDTSFALHVTTRIDERIVGSAAIEIPRVPLEAFTFALNKCAQSGRPLRAGQYISTGMITGVHDIRVGQVARITFGIEGQAGEIRCRAVRAQPLGPDDSIAPSGRAREPAAMVPPGASEP